MYDLSSREHHPNDVLVMASDGLWDMLSSEEVARRVTMTLQQLDEDNPERYRAFLLFSINVEGSLKVDQLVV